MTQWKSSSPTNAQQELNELRAERTRFRQGPPVHPRLREIEERRAEIHANELGDLQEVANRAELAGYIEGQSSALGMSAVATRDIAAGELLLFTADNVFRTTGARFEPLAKTSVGRYFRPNRGIPKGQGFAVDCIQDAPEEIWNVKNHYMPHSDRARDPERAYRTEVSFCRISR